MRTSRFASRKAIASTVAFGLALSIGGGFAPAQGADKHLVYGSAAGFPQLNPIILTFGTEMPLTTLLWAGLTTKTQAGGIGRDLATSWHANPTATQWTFSLRKGAKFSDGSPLDSKAVKAVFDYTLKVPVSQFKRQITMIKTIKTGANSITFLLSSPNAIFAEAVSSIRLIKPSEVNTTINKNPSTSGPYKVVQFTPNVSLNVVPNPNYFGTKAKLSGIDFTKLADSTAAVNALRGGSIDFLDHLTFSDIASVKSNPALQILHATSSSQTIVLHMDNQNAPGNDLRVRQAIAYAVDRQSMLDDAYFGQGQLSTYNTVVADASPWQCPASAGLIKYSYDPQKAKALFAAAGITKLTWWGTSGIFPEFTTMAEILQADLKKIGVDLTIQNNEVGTWAAKFYPPGKTYPGLLVPNIYSLQPEPAYAMSQMKSGGSESNWNNPTYDALYDKAISILDPVKRKAAWCEGLKMENSQVPLAAMFNLFTVHAAKTGVKGIWVAPDGVAHLENASMTD
jgi:peptide/nickel transport system substrate-binding protein